MPGFFVPTGVLGSAGARIAISFPPYSVTFWPSVTFTVRMRNRKTLLKTTACPFVTFNTLFCVDRHYESK